MATKKLTDTQRLAAYRWALRNFEKQRFSLLCNTLDLWLFDNDYELWSYNIPLDVFPEFANRKPEGAGYLWFEISKKGNEQRRQLLLSCIAEVEEKIKSKKRKPVKQ